MNISGTTPTGDADQLDTTHLQERFQALIKQQPSKERLDRLIQLHEEARAILDAHHLSSIQSEVSAAALEFYPYLCELYEKARNGSYRALLNFRENVLDAELPKLVYPEDYDSLLVWLCPSIPLSYEFVSTFTEELKHWQTTPGLLQTQAQLATCEDNPDPVRAAYIMALFYGLPVTAAKAFGPAIATLMHDLGKVVVRYKTVCNNRSGIVNRNATITVFDIGHTRR